MVTLDKVFKIEGVEVREIGDYSLFTLYQTLDETIIYIVDENDSVVGSIGASYDEDVKIDFREVRWNWKLKVFIDSVFVYFSHRE